MTSPYFYMYRTGMSSDMIALTNGVQHMSVSAGQSSASDKKEETKANGSNSGKMHALVSQFFYNGTTAPKGLNYEKSLWQEVEYVYRITQDALLQLVAGNYSAFDALVSDTACHIRGLMVIAIAQKVLSDVAFAKGLTTLLGVLEKKIALVRSKGANTGDREKIEQGLFMHGLVKEGFDIEVPEDVILLGRLHLLTKSKEVRQVRALCKGCPSEVDHDIDRTNCKQIDDDKLLSSRRQQHYVEQSKLRVSEASCKAIKLAADRHSDLMTRIMLTQVRLVTGRSELPAYYTLKAVFDSLLATNTPLFVMCKDAPHTVDGGVRDPVLVNLFMKPDTDGEQFVLVKPTQEDETRPLLFIRGQRSGATVRNESVRAFVERFKKAPFMTIVHTLGASHPPYTDKDSIESIPLFAEMLSKEVSSLSESEATTRSDLLKEHKKVLALRKLADQMGTSMRCQHLFTMVHISVTTLKEQKAKGHTVYNPEAEGEGA